MDTEEYNWLGVALPFDVGANKVMVTPLAFYDEEVASWQPIDASDRKRYFPNEGKVIIFEREWFGCEPNRLYQFWPEMNRQSKVSPDAPSYAKYWASQSPTPTSLAEVLDWTTLAASADLPAILAQQGALKHVYAQRIYIRHDTHLYGPIHIDQQTGLPREYAQSNVTGGPLLLVRVHMASSKALFHVTVGDTRVVLLDEQYLDAPRGEADWSLPQVVIKRVLEASNKLPPTTHEDERLVDRRIKQLARANSQEGLEALRLPLATLERAQHIIGDQQGILETLDTVSELIIGLPALRPRVDAVIAQEAQARADEVAREITARLAEEQEHVVQAQAEVRAAQGRLVALSAEIAQAQEHKARLQRDLAAFEAQMAQRVEALRAEPMQALAELHVASALLPTLGAFDGGLPSNAVQRHNAGAVSLVATAQSNLNGTLVPDAPGRNGVTWHASEHVETLATPDTLKRQWIAAARRAEVRSQEVRACAAVLLAGSIPVPVGDGAAAALHALGDVLAGGRVWNVPVPITALSPVDLFGSIDPATHQFIPAAGALADIVLAAEEHPNDLGLVIFEGWDRVPGMPTYVPLLRQYMEAQRHMAGDRAPAPLSLFHPRALAADDPYAALAWLSWPANLLIAGVLDEADSSFPIPPECASWMVRPETTRKSQRLPHPEDGANVLSIGASVWASWSKNVRGDDAMSPSSDSGEQHAGAALLEASLRLWGTPTEAELRALVNASDWNANGQGRARMEGRLQS